MAQKIGIVTSLTWSDPFKTAFEDGYKAAAGGTAPAYAGNPSPIEAGGDYDSVGTTNRKMYRQVDKLNSVANIVVSVGGLVAAHPVVQKSTLPFIVLIGRIPELSDFDLTDNENYCGGVELHMVQDNINRRNALVSKFKIDSNKVFLLFNPNSRMGRFEAHEWRAQGGDAIAAAMPGSNDTDEFVPAFQRLRKRGAAGVVISSDPFFLSKQADLVGTANTAFGAFGITMCYPFDAFGGPTVPTQNSAISYGPDLTYAYNAMGQKAHAIAAALDGNKPLPPVLLDTLPLPANPTAY